MLEGEKRMLQNGMTWKRSKKRIVGAWNELGIKREELKSLL